LSKIFLIIFKKKKAFLLLALPAAAYLGSYEKRSKKPPAWAQSHGALG
jgi:hypothetical protein